MNSIPSYTEEWKNKSNDSVHLLAKVPRFNANPDTISVLSLVI